MAASELIQEDDGCIQVISTDPPSPPQSTKAAKHNPTHHTSVVPPPEDILDGDSKGKRQRRKITDLLKGNQLINSLCNKIRQHCDYNKITKESDDPLPKEWWKTGMSFIYAAAILVFNAVVIAVIHERVPDKSVSPPLPDKFFDYIDRVPWAFKATEICGLTLCGLWMIQWLGLKHRAIVARRCFFLIGTLYLYRCITMYVTTLPVPGKHMVCAPKLYNDTTGKMWRILRMISGGGLNVTGSHILCGDYLYSGHTIMLTLSYLFIKEYCPPKMWWYRWLCFCLSIFGLICILLGHEHYSIDVVVAYFITTSTFKWYYARVEAHVHSQDPNKYLTMTWWNPIFKFMERNVKASVPIEFALPVSIPSTSCRRRYSIVDRWER